MNVVPKVKAAPHVTEAAGPYAGTHLPLISFIVVNYNYGRFLRQCVDSIFAQTYPVIECIVVDNKSTDESSQVIADLQEIYPQLGVIYEPANLGQSAACVDGFHKSSGQFVVFADDYYFETFAETHFLVHLSLPQAVGFTSSDMVQIVDGSLVLGTVFEAAGAHDPKLFGKIDLDAARATVDFPGWRPTVELAILSVRSVSRETLAWVWAPTSGTVYRRDALALFADSTALPSLRCATDAFFNFGINSFTSSVLIDKSLAAYRIHGNNIFAKHASLNNLRNFLEITDEGARAAKLALTHVVANLNRFADVSWDFQRLIYAMTILNLKAVEIRWRRPLRRKLRSFAIAALRFYWSAKLRRL